MAAIIFARGAHTMNTIVFKPIGRKVAYHGSSAETIRETLKLQAEEATNKSQYPSDQNNAADDNMWVPHSRTGIYYPKGHEKVMEDVPGPKSRNDVASVNWVSYNDNA